MRCQLGLIGLLLVQHYMEIRMPPGQASLNAQTGWYNGPVVQDYEIWYTFIRAFAQHLWGKYGEEEMSGWKFEVAAQL